MLAHGVGTRADLPLPTSYVTVGAAVVLVASFAALGALWRSPRLAGDEAGRPVPAALARLLDSSVTTGVLRAVVLVLSLGVVAAAFIGSPLLQLNPAPWALYVTFWVGLVPVSLLVGPVWARLNPLRTLYAGLARVTGPAPFTHVLPRLGLWPGALSLLAFAWMELAAPDRSAPRRVGLFLLVYAVVQLFGALCFGAGWFAQGDGFEVWSRLLGRLAVIGRRADRALVWRSPLDGVAGAPAVPGLWAVVVVLVGTTGFDGVTRTTWWQDARHGQEGGALTATLAMAATVLVVAALFAVGAGAAGRIAGRTGLLDRYASSLVPIAAGYAVTHYFSLFLLDGQMTWILASDPFAQGLDLLGTAGRQVDYTLVSPRVISLVQAGAIVIAHLVALALAHDRALVVDAERGGRPHRPWVAQLPMLVVMVVLTSGGLLLLLGA
ncbi:MAG TPA: hypothetical protein VM097_03750 [Mycobacteriales bacterium]|nr:hypothetical protein [Mycobacteriales bacterium]